MDPQQLAEIWDRHYDRLLLIARSIGGHVADAACDDAVQEAFIELAQCKSPPDDVIGWMVRVVRNRMLDAVRSGLRRQRRETDYGRDAWLEKQEASTPPASEFGSAEELTNMIAALPDRQRQIVVMHIWGELTFRQIADITGGSRSAVHREFQHGIHALRNHIETTS